MMDRPVRAEASDASADKQQTAEFDYIVVGSGAGGGPLAARLAQNGQRVLLLEAGLDTAKEADVLPAEVYDVPALNAASTEDSLTSWGFSVRHYDDGQIQAKDTKYDADQDPSTKGDTGKGGIFYPRASALGGCTSHHAMIIIRPNDSDWEDIADITGDASWRSVNMQGYFPKIEKCLYYAAYRGFFGRFLGGVQAIATFINPALQLDPNGHGSKGWQPTSFINPLIIAGIVRGDRQFLRLLFDVAWSALSGRAPAKAFKLAVGHFQILQFLDPNVRAKYVRDRAHLSLISIGTDGKRRTGLREWIRSVETDPKNQLVVKTGAHATRLIFAPGQAAGPPRAVGVEVALGSHLYRASDREPVHRGATQYFASKEIIVAGGAFNSPQLLMLSGIGEANHLHDRGISGPRDVDGNEICPVINLPGVGRNLQDRYEVTVVSEMKADFSTLKGARFQPCADLDNTDDPLLRQWRTDQSGLYATNGGALAFMISSDANQRRDDPDLFVFGVPAAFRGYYWGWSKELLRRTKSAEIDQRNLWTWVILKAYTRNNRGAVRLRTVDPFDVPDINFNSFSEPSAARDVAALVESIEHVREINTKITGMLGEVQPGRQDLDEWVKNEAWGHHACGTCRMGSDRWKSDVTQLNDRKAVLDSQFRVHGVSGLRVVDASVFPRIPGYFIVTPTFMIAEKAADVLLADSAVYPKRLMEQEAQAVAERRAALSADGLQGDGEDDLEAADGNAGVEAKYLPVDCIGLAMSGGGIRSATFGLGVLQALAETKLLRRIDFMSTVSGGGYAASFLGRLFSRFEAGTPNVADQIAATLTDPNSPEMWWLRRHADYLNDAGRSDLQTDLAVIARNLAATLFCISLLLIGTGGALRWLADYLFARESPLTLRGVVLSPWWRAPVIVALLLVLPIAVGYWLTPNPGSPRRYSLNGIIAWMIMLAVGILGLGVSNLREPILVGIAVLLLAWLWQEVLRWGKPAGKEDADFAHLYRNRLSRALGTTLFFFVITVTFLVIDSIARLFAHDASALMMGTALATPPVLLFLRSLTVNLIPRGVSQIAARASVSAGSKFTIVVLSISLASLILITSNTAAHWAFNTSNHVGIWATGAALIVSAAIGHAINFVNLSSLQQSLTQKLTRTFLGASNNNRVHPLGTNRPVPVQVSDDNDDVFLQDYHPERSGGPLHLINVCVNQTVDHLSGRQLRHNKGLGMAIGPCGLSVGWQYHALWQRDEKLANNRAVVEALPTAADPNAFHPLARRDGRTSIVEELTLGRWMAVSAAAVSTGAGRNSSLPLSLLLGILNIRLGYWWNSGIGSGARPGRYPPDLWRLAKALPSKLFAVQAMLLNEWRGYFEGPVAKRWYLSDGGHFENSGIYELIRRRLPLIIAVDGSRDENYRLDDIAILMRQVRLDFGAEIQWLEPQSVVPGAQPWSGLSAAADGLAHPIPIPEWIKAVITKPESIGSPASLQRNGTTTAAFARVAFQDDVTKACWILLIKANLASKLPVDVTNYASVNSGFPNQSTVDQFFEDDQWESYRALGQAAGRSVFS
ncbi:choline dehydrogenase-like flavoprotein [Rhizobium ruizarguesonis]